MVRSVNLRSLWKGGEALKVFNSFSALSEEEEDLEQVFALECAEEEKEEVAEGSTDFFNWEELSEAEEAALQKGGVEAEAEEQWSEEQPTESKRKVKALRKRVKEEVMKNEKRKKEEDNKASKDYQKASPACLKGCWGTPLINQGGFWLLGGGGALEGGLSFVTLDM